MCYGSAHPRHTRSVGSWRTLLLARRADVMAAILKALK